MTVETRLSADEISWEYCDGFAANGRAWQLDFSGEGEVSVS